MTFLDTNILVYANDQRDEVKQAKALDLVTKHLVDRTGVISTQVFQEYASVAISKLHQPIAVVVHQLHLLESFTVVALDPALVRRALELHQLYQLSYWDAQIVAAAEKGRCTELLTEDLNPGQVYGDLRCVSPW